MVMGYLFEHFFVQWIKYDDGSKSVKAADCHSGLHLLALLYLANVHLLTKSITLISSKVSKKNTEQELVEKKSFIYFSAVY